MLGKIFLQILNKKPGFWAIVATVIVVIIIGIGLTTNPINSVRLPEADDINFSAKILDRVVYGTQIAGDRVMDFSEAKAPEFADFIKELRVSRREISKSREDNRDSTNQIHLAYRGFSDNETIYNLYFNFNADFTEIWLDNGTKPSLSYRVKKPGEVRAFFERQFGSVTRIREVGSVRDLWEAHTKYIGDNSAVGKLLGLVLLPENLHHNHFMLHTNGANRGLEWFLDEVENATYQAEQLNQPALLLFALIDNMEDFYITTKDPFGGGTELHYNRAWADKVVDGDIRDYGQSPERLQELIDYFGTGEIDANIQDLVITTPRDSYSPFMSSMFGFELVLNAPENSAKFVYTCDKGSFCTYKDAKIENIGNNVTTNETVYWWPFKDDEHIEEMDKILVSVTALDKDGKKIAFGTATIECSPEGSWFKFIE